MNATKFWAAARNAALKVVAFWVLVFAAYLAIGRQFFPYIEHIKPEVEIWLTDQLGTQVEIGMLKGEWVRFNPVVHLSDVRFGDELAVSKMTLAPGIYESIVRGGPSFIRFEVTDFEAELNETSSGWQFSGINNRNDTATNFDLAALLELLRRQQEVQFSNTSLTIKPLDLPEFELRLDQGQLSGYGTDNGLLASATLRANDIDIPIELQVETTQNAQGLNRVYFRHGEIDLSPWLKGINDDVSDANVAGEYWVNLEGTQWLNATSRIDVSSMTLEGRHSRISVNNAQFETYLENKVNGFESWLNLLTYELNGTRYETTQAKISHRANRVKAQWDSLPASLVGYWFSLSDPSGFWTGISPKGFIEQGTLTLLSDQSNSMFLSAQVADFSMQPHQSVPGLTNLSGSMRIEGASGEMALTSNASTLQLPNIFSESLSTVIPVTTIRWDTDPEYGIQAKGYAQVELLPSQDMPVESENLEADINWTSNSPTTEQKKLGRQGSVKLEVTVDELDESWARTLIDNELIDPNASADIQRRLRSGIFENVHLDYLSSADDNGERFNQFFINANYRDASVLFLDNWYVLENLNGEFHLDNDGLNMTSQSGYYPGFEVKAAKLGLAFDDSVLKVSFNGSSTTSEALYFLKTGPLRNQFGNQLDEWQAEGELSLSGQLSFPLAEPDNLSILITSDILGSDLALNNLDFFFTDVSGELIYNSERGLYANGLSLKHLTLEQQVNIESSVSNGAVLINIGATGKTPVDFWGTRFQDPYLSSRSDVIDHETEISISPQKVIVESVSSLAGLMLDFPEPLNKPADQILPLKLKVTLDERNWMLVEAELADRLTTFFELDQAKNIYRGSLAVGSALNVRDEKGVFFDIDVANADGDAWWQTIQRIRALYADIPEPIQPLDLNQQTFEETIKAINISAREIQYLSQPWTEAEVSILRNSDAWLVGFNAEEGQGQVLIAHTEEPIFADINWLSLTTGEEEIAFEDAIDPLLDYLPTDVPNMQLQLGKLIWNQKDLGAWRAELMSKDEQLLVKNTVGRMEGATLTGDLVWQKEDGKHATTFIGDIAINNVLDVLNTWQYAPVLTSKSGVVNIDSRWQGSPAHFDFKRLQGEIDLKLDKGAILDVEEYEGVKLIGLLNFTRVIQRIALDFSDLLQEGITFDSIEGELLFDRGFARVGEKLVIDGSATKFKFSGDADLLSDELDIDMVLTVPLSSTFPLVALLAGVSPQAAAAIYVTERVFNNELERLSSARMHITGSFEAPDTKFYRVFDSNLGEQGPTVTDRFKDVVPEGVSQP